MLINTVVLFLNDALPMVIILAILIAMSTRRCISSQWIYHAILLSIFTTSLLSVNLDFIVQSYENTGLERFFTLGYMLIYSLIVVLLFIRYNQFNLTYWLWCALAIIVLVSTINSTNFLVYFLGYWSQVDAIKSLIVGVVLGSGICISIGILLYFFILYSDNKFSFELSSVLILFYGAGQLIQGSNLLLQIDVLPSGSSLWDMNSMIKEDSELGHFLTALFGYDASPSLLQFVLYFLSLAIPIGVILLWKSSFIRTSKTDVFCENKENEHKNNE